MSSRDFNCPHQIFRRSLPSLFISSYHVPYPSGAVDDARRARRDETGSHVMIRYDPHRAVRYDVMTVYNLSSSRLDFDEVFRYHASHDETEIANAPGAC